MLVKLPMKESTLPKRSGRKNASVKAQIPPLEPLRAQQPFVCEEWGASDPFLSSVRSGLGLPYPAAMRMAGSVEMLYSALTSGRMSVSRKLAYTSDTVSYSSERCSG